MTPLLHCPCLPCAGPVPSSPHPCLINAIDLSAPPPPPPPPPQYAYLLTMPTDVPCIGSILSCHPCWRWRQRSNSKPSDLTTLMPMQSLHVACSSAATAAQAAAAIFNRRPTQPPNANAQPSFFNATAALPPSSNSISSWLLCADFVLENARVHFIAPCDCKFSQRRTVNDGTC